MNLLFHTHLLYANMCIKANYNIIWRINNATNNVGMAIIIPYKENCLKDNFTSWSFTSPVNMIPANAPIGVKKAPMLEPIIKA